MNGITFAWLEWQIETFISNANEFGYEDIEWREGLDNHVRSDMTAAQTGLP